MVQINDVVREVLELVQDELRVDGIIATAEYDKNIPEIEVNGCINLP